MRDPQRWTAVDFLRAAAEFERMVPDHGTWTEQRLESNPPRLVRLRRLRALEKVFELEPGFESLWSGEFVGRRPFEVYQPLVQRILRESETLKLGSMLRPPQVWDVEHVYGELFKFLTKHAYPMLDFNSGVLEASGFYLYTVRRVNQSLEGLPALIQPLEELVGLVIDPDSESFSLEELAVYGWPPDDLFLLDADYV